VYVLFALVYWILQHIQINFWLNLCRFRHTRRMHLIVSVQDNSMFQMTALCLSASFCFLVCVTPSMVLLIGKPYWNVPPSDWYAIAKSITNQVLRNHRLHMKN